MTDHHRIVEEAGPVSMVCMIVGVDDIPNLGLVPLFDELDDLPGFARKRQGIDHDSTVWGQNPTRSDLRIQFAGKYEDIVGYKLTEHRR
jgi:hypothetical protein